MYKVLNFFSRLLRRLSRSLTPHLWVICEECHGEVSYWLTRRQAIKEALRLARDGAEVDEDLDFEGRAWHDIPAEQLRRWKKSLEDDHEVNGCVSLYYKYLCRPW